MRIILLPLTTTTRMVIAQRTGYTAVIAANPRRIDDKLTLRAHKMWADWESSSTWWKKQVTKWGNKAMDNISYEEWSLKGIPRAPPGLLMQSPKKWWEVWRSSGENATPEEIEGLVSGKVALVFPPRHINADEVAPILRKFAVSKQPYHLKMMLIYGAVSPLTLPVALLPVIPNIPGFYCLYRMWSHWKAYEGAKVLDRIVSEDKYILEPSYTLESALKPAPGPEDAPLRATSTGEETLLDSSQVKAVSEALDAPELEGELNRAIVQTRERITKENNEAAKITPPEK
ncbi:mitochondrial K+-H+ exchange-related-domain-containing protein [Myxozyma melibiosi]|uniref:Mitochondrial K+-H+ exchange-related-domain-containing protein n=1 Tax=Myxozyma melibiosi TaxID=54550 RepID=A0ABR1F6U0_9ASCO